MKKTIFLFLSFIFIACGGSDEEIPEESAKGLEELLIENSPLAYRYGEFEQFKYNGSNLVSFATGKIDCNAEGNIFYKFEEHSIVYKRYSGFDYKMKTYQLKGDIFQLQSYIVGGDFFSLDKEDCQTYIHLPTDGYDRTYKLHFEGAIAIFEKEIDFSYGGEKYRFKLKYYFD